MDWLSTSGQWRKVGAQEVSSGWWSGSEYVRLPHSHSAPVEGIRRVQAVYVCGVLKLYPVSENHGRKFAVSLGEEKRTLFHHIQQPLWLAWISLIAVLKWSDNLTTWATSSSSLASSSLWIDIRHVTEAQ